LIYNKVEYCSSCFNRAEPWTWSFLQFSKLLGSQKCKNESMESWTRNCKDNISCGKCWHKHILSKSWISHLSQISGDPLWSDPHILWLTNKIEPDILIILKQKRSYIFKVFFVIDTFLQLNWSWTLFISTGFNRFFFCLLVFSAYDLRASTAFIIYEQNIPFYNIYTNITQIFWMLQCKFYTGLESLLPEHVDVKALHKINHSN
jgi:hypothetical protein